MKQEWVCSQTLKSRMYSIHFQFELINTNYTSRTCSAKITDFGVRTKWAAPSADTQNVLLCPLHNSVYSESRTQLKQVSVLWQRQTYNLSLSIIIFPMRMELKAQGYINIALLLLWQLANICNLLMYCPVAQMVEHGASNAKIMGSFPRESKSW